MQSYSGMNVRDRVIEYGTEDRAVFNFFNAVYAWMCVGLALTAGVAWIGANYLNAVPFMHTPGAAVAFLLGMVVLAWSIGSAARRLNPGLATALFLIYASLVGLMLSSIFLVYNLSTIGMAFLMTGGTFGIMSVYGFVTKRDLTSIGSILIMAVVGLFLASLVNIFLASNALSWFITYAVLGVFIAMTAYDTQKLKYIAEETRGNARAAASYAIIGSLSLYLDFINMFMSILRILGDRR